MKIKFDQDGLEVLQVKNAVLYFFLLLLQVFFNFSPDIINKCSRFFEILLEKNLKFVSSKESNLVLLNLSLLLLLAEVNAILEKRIHERDVLVAYSISYIKIIIILSEKIITLHIGVCII